MTASTRDGQGEYRVAWPDVPGWRTNMAEIGPLGVFHLAESCKPSKLAESGRAFEDVLGWVTSEQRPRLRNRDIHPARLVRFSTHRFVLVQLPTSAIRLWPRAGGMPADWTDRHTVAELAELIRTKAVEIPEQATRLLGILDAARTPQGLHRLRAIPPIALPEFHGSTRSSRSNAPWTLDDGSHRALTLAVAGDAALWCLAGYPLQTSPRPRGASVWPAR